VCRESLKRYGSCDLWTILLSCRYLIIQWHSFLTVDCMSSFTCEHLRSLTENRSWLRKDKLHTSAFLKVVTVLHCRLCSLWYFDICTKLQQLSHCFWMLLILIMLYINELFILVTEVLVLWFWHCWLGIRRGSWPVKTFK